MANDNQSEKPLGIGIVGLGIGRHHLKAYQQIDDVKVISIADTDSDRLEKIGDENDISHRYTDYEALISREDIDCISVCTPNHLHAPVSIAALKRGKHVLVEKPISSTLADGERMIAAAKTAKRVLQVVFNHRERGDVQTLKAIIDQGTLGRIYHAKAWWLRRNGIPGMGSWFTQKEMAGGGPLIDLGVHMLDMALFLMSEPEPMTVSAAVYSELGRVGRGGNPNASKTLVSDTYEVEDLASAFIRLKGNATLLLETSWATYRANGDEFGITLYGTEGGAEIKVINYVQYDTLTVYTDLTGVPGDIKLHTGKGEGHVAVIRSFVDRIRSGAWHEHTGYEGLLRTRIIDACYRSAMQNCEVQL